MLFFLNFAAGLHVPEMYPTSVTGSHTAMSSWTKWTDLFWQWGKSVFKHW